MTTQSAEMPPLPDDENAAKAVVRKMLMDEAVVLLKASGLKYANAQFDVPIAFDDNDAQSGDLTIGFDPCSDEQEQAMTAAIWANGWKKGVISHGVNVHKGPRYLQWGKGYGGCLFEITTVNISQHMPMTDDIAVVPNWLPQSAWLTSYLVATCEGMPHWLARTPLADDGPTARGMDPGR